MVGVSGISAESAASAGLSARRWLVAKLVALALTGLGFAVLTVLGKGFIDLEVYRVGGQTWLAGFELYSRQFPAPLPGPALPFIYPPFAAVLFSAVAFVPWNVAVVFFLLISLAALYLSCMVVAKFFEQRNSVALLGAATIAAILVWAEPVRQTLGFGQINLLLMLLVAADCLVRHPRWPRGTLIGIAAAIKLTPALFLLFFIARRQWRPVIVATASFLSANLLALAVAPADSVQYWLHTMFDLNNRVGVAHYTNQSLRGMLHRYGLDPGVESVLWCGLSLIAVGCAWFVAARLRARGEDALALFVIAAGGLLASPLSWSHHWVWIAPALVALTYAWLRLSKVSLVVLIAILATIFGIGPHSLLPNGSDREFTWTFWQQLVGNSYVWVGVALLGWALYHVRSPIPPESVAVIASAEIGSTKHHNTSE
jgi:alpha-1,2-mannosyltransferase